VSSKPTAITIGGDPGVMVDVHLAPTRTKRCPGDSFPSQLLLVDSARLHAATVREQDQSVGFVADCGANGVGKSPRGGTLTGRVPDDGVTAEPADRRVGHRVILASLD